MRLALVALLLAGCAPGIKVVRYVGPPRVDPGPPGPLFVEVRGTDGAVQMIEPSLRRIAERELGFELVTERTPQAAVLEAEVERWWQEQPQLQQQGSSGRPPPVQITEFMQLVVTLKKTDGATVSAKYDASQRDSPRQLGSTSGNAQLAAANARQVLEQFLSEFAPESRSERLDFEDDATTAAGLQYAKAGDLPAAENAWREQDSAAAHYNLGAVLEARGALEAALLEYEAAARLSPDPKYAGAAEAVKKSAAFRRRNQRTSF